MYTAVRLNQVINDRETKQQEEQLQKSIVLYTRVELCCKQRMSNESCTHPRTPSLHPAKCCQQLIVAATAVRWVPVA